MEKRVLVAFVLSMAVFLIWSQFLGPKPKTEPEANKTPAITEKTGVETTGGEDTKHTKETTETNKLEESSDIPEDNAVKEEPDVQEAEAREVVVHTDLYTAVITENGARLASLTMNKYRATHEEGAPPKELVTVEEQADLPLGLLLEGEKEASLVKAYFQADKTEIDLRGKSNPETLVFTHRGKDGLVVKKVYSFNNETYLIDLKVVLDNAGPKNVTTKVKLELNSNPIANKDRYAGFGALIDGKVKDEIKPKDLFEDLGAFKGTEYQLDWAAYEDQYFMAAVLPGDKENTRVSAEPMGDKGMRIWLTGPEIQIGAGTEKAVAYQLYYGPKDYQTLNKMNDKLAEAINFGWLDWLSKPLLVFMTWLYGFVGNFGVVIIIVTIIIKIIFWPLTAKSYKSMKGMQKLQPMIMKMREKYKDDREAMNREMMALYKDYKVNPLGGCLPMVIQIPVFIAFYKLLDYSLELRHAPFALWISDLSQPDRLFATTAFTVPLMEPPAGIPILTLLMGASMLLQQKMTPTPGDPTQAKIMMLMPIFFTFIFINFPAGLVLYWLTNNILSIGQQTLINKRP